MAKDNRTFEQGCTDGYRTIDHDGKWTEALARECPSAMKAALGIFLAIMAGSGANAGPDGKEVRISVQSIPQLVKV
jgi:hypothetical protein